MILPDQHAQGPPNEECPPATTHDGQEGTTSASDSIGNNKTASASSVDARIRDAIRRGADEAELAELGRELLPLLPQGDPTPAKGTPTMVYCLPRAVHADPCGCAPADLTPIVASPKPPPGRISEYDMRKAAEHRAARRRPLRRRRW